jgi:folate-binding protein YgfZ
VSAAGTASTAYRALTEGAGLVDRSESGKLALTGSDAKGFLQGQVTNDTEALEPGTGVYAAFLTQKAKMLGDLRILDTGDELLLLTERVALAELFNMIRRYKIGYDVELHKRTLERGLVSVEGPQARELTEATELPETEHANAMGSFDGIAVLRIVTEAGIDLICDAADTERLLAALVARGAEPASEDEAEVTRVERGRPRYGVELDDSVIPQEAALNDRAVSFTKGCYVGQETVARLFYRGKPNRHLRGLKLSAPVAPGSELKLGEKVVGRLGSCVESPRLGTIGLAIVRREAEPGATLAAGEDGATAELVELPFPG